MFVSGVALGSWQVITNQTEAIKLHFQPPTFLPSSPQGTPFWGQGDSFRNSDEQQQGWEVGEDEERHQTHLQIANDKASSAPVCSLLFSGVSFSIIFASLVSYPIIRNRDKFFLFPD